MRLSGVPVALMLLLGVPSSAAAADPIGSATPLVHVGPGAVESSQRQVVRTQDGVVYIASVEDDGWGAGAFAQLHMYRATTAGIPSAFTAQDAEDNPRVESPHTLTGGDARIDAEGIIHLTYAVLDGDTLTVEYQTFDTGAQAWGSAEHVAMLPSGGDGRRGRVVSALALDASGVPLVAMASSSGVSAWSREAEGGWSRAAIDGDYGLHPSLAFDASGRGHVAWSSSPYRGASIRYASRAKDGTWSPVEVVATGNVLANDTLDQSPSLAFDADARPMVLWLDDRDDVRVTTRASERVWTADDPPATFAHTPALYARGGDRLVFLGHDVDVHPAYLSYDVTAGWSSVSVFPAPPDDDGRYAYDGSASVRFDPLFDPDCATVDVVFFDEDSDRPGRAGAGKPDLYYAAVTLPEPQGGCPPAPGLGGEGGSGPPVGAPVDPPVGPPVDPAVNPPANPPAVLLGHDAIAPQVDANASGMAEAFQVAAAATGALRSISVYVDEASTGEMLTAGAYTDEDGHPGTLLARGEAVAARAGEWNAIALPPTPIADGDRYWLAILGTGEGRLAFRDDPHGGCRSETTPSGLVLDALPPTWTTGNEYTDCPVSAYAAGG